MARDRILEADARDQGFAAVTHDGGAVDDDKAFVCVPQEERVGEALDGVAQAGMGAFCLRLALAQRGLRLLQIGDVGERDGEESVRQRQPADVDHRTVRARALIA